MQDYDGPSAYHPLIGEGAWPDQLVNTLGLLVLLATLVLCAVAYRMGQRSERAHRTHQANRAPEIIYTAIRRQIDIALIATGEGIFRPARNLTDTIDAYLGPVLKLHDGPQSLGVAIQKLKHALGAMKKKVPDDSHDHHHASATGGSTVIITGGGGGGANGPSASASASAGGNSVQVVEPARIIELPHGGGHGGHGGGHGQHEPRMKEVELTAKERVLAVREALELLAEGWQKERVERELKAAQQALLIERPIGEKPGAIVRPRAASPPGAQPRPKPEGGRGGFSLFKL
jgi:uncharacterized membrane protein YidH (DUF202 family)